MDEIDGKNGVKIAASRRAKFECGLNLSPREISHVARIIYSSDCSEIFSENELDHCLVSKTNHQLDINADEISNIKVIVFRYTEVTPSGISRSQEKKSRFC